MIPFFLLGFFFLFGQRKIRTVCGDQLNMNTHETTDDDKAGFKYQEDSNNKKRKLNPNSTEADTAVSDTSENGNSVDAKKARMESTRLSTIFGTKPMNDTVQYVANFLWRYCDQDNIEVF
jgi:hypothetical protein